MVSGFKDKRVGRRSSSSDKCEKMIIGYVTQVPAVHSFVKTARVNKKEIVIFFVVVSGNEDTEVNLSDQLTET